MKFKKLLSVAVLVGFATVALSACGQNQKASNGKINIVTTTNVYSDIAKNVVGKYGTAEAIITKSSMDPHDFEPTTADAKKSQMPILL